jgi:hypothetical protein
MIEKYHYLAFIEWEIFKCVLFPQLKRFKVYSALLQMKLATFPELEPSLVEVAIGEVDEPSSLPSSPEQPRIIPLEADLNPDENVSITSPTGHPSGSDRNPVYRSQSDRYSYRAAIHRHEPDFDI